MKYSQIFPVSLLNVFLEEAPIILLEMEFFQYPTFLQIKSTEIFDS